MKLRLTIISLAATLFSICAVAQQVTNKALLWRISGHGMAKPSYLFGTIDMICPDDYLWTKQMEDCFGKSEQVCFSMDLSAPDFKTELSKAIINKGGKKLADYFSAADYPLVVRYTKDSFNIDISKYQVLKPMGIQPYIIKKLLGCSNAVSYDARLLANAQKAGKKVVGLQTVQELIEEVEATHFNEMIARTLAEMAHGSDYYHQYRTNLMNAYKRMDLQQENIVCKGSKALSKEDLKVLLDQASERWVARMPGVMARSSVFFALNSLNFWGDEGIINLLRKAGYTVEPLL